MFTLRPKLTFNSIANRGQVIPSEIGLYASANAYYEIVLNGALGAPAEKDTRLTNQAAAVAAHTPEPEINEDWVPKFIREDWAKRRKAA